MTIIPCVRAVEKGGGIPGNYPPPGNGSNGVSRWSLRNWKSAGGVVVTVHTPWTSALFGPFRAEKCVYPLTGQGDSPIFADFAAKIGTVPVNGYAF